MRNGQAITCSNPTSMLKLFITECLLFGSKEKSSRIIGVLSWISLLMIGVALGIFLAYLKA